MRIGIDIDDSIFLSGARLNNTKNYTSSSYSYHPKIYEADGSGNVVCNNPLYDETVINEPITIDSGINRVETNNPANELTVNNTWFYYSDKASQMTAFGKGKVGTFGNSKMGSTLLTDDYWLASRCILVFSNRAYFYLRCAESGSWSGRGLCDSYATSISGSNAFRIVVSIPASHINVADDGTVSLK